MENLIEKAPVKDLFESNEFETVQDLLNASGHRCQGSARTNVVKSLNEVLKTGVVVTVVRKSRVMIEKSSNFKWNLRVSFGSFGTMFYCGTSINEFHLIRAVADFLKKEKVKNLMSERFEVQTMSDCHKCNGLGHIPGFAHVYNGVCFRCGGVGKVGKTKIEKAG